MSRKNRRGPQPLKGRGAPIGPVFGLARAEQIERAPLKHKSKSALNDRGDLELLWSKVLIDKVRINAEILKLAAGKISVDNLQTVGVSLTAGQRKPLEYDAGGNPRLDAARQVMDAEQWRDMQEGGKLLVVSGNLIRLASGMGAPAQFDFLPMMWGVADPEQHAQGKLALPTPAEVAAVL
jgi:hypothetical protein